MSDIKPKRPMRVSATSEVALGEAVFTTSAPIVAPEPIASVAPVVPVAAPVVVAPTIVVAPVVDAAGTSTMVSTDRTEVTATDAWGVLAETQGIFLRCLEQAAVEMTGMSRTGFSAASDAAIALLGVRTLAEAVEIGAGLAQRGTDALIEGSARLSEIGLAAVADASRPVLSRLGPSSDRIAAS